MTKTRVRKPFIREDAQAHPGLTTELEEFPAIELPGEEKRSTKVKNAAAAKMPEKVKHPSNLMVRTATGAVYILLTVVCIWASEASTAVYLSVLSAICAGEFYYMLRSDAKLPNEFLGICAAALFPLATWLFGISGVVVVFAIFVLTLLVWYVFWGAVLILGLFASVWGNDAFAYLVGSAIGKHKLAPHISPKKSWEGFIAGLVVAMGFWCLLTLIPGVTMSIPQALVFGLINGLSGVLGDLVESRIKRNSGFKDSGTIMPGHGGLLDRCDSQFLVILTGTIMLVLGGCIPYAI